MLALAQAHATVASKYSDAGWTIINMPRGCIVDFIASSKGIQPRIHFIQVVIPAIEKTARFSLEAQNAFIQNALSNSAAPVYANVVDGKVSCVDVNSRSRIIITKQEGAKQDADPKPAPKSAASKQTPAASKQAPAAKNTTVKSKQTGGKRPGQ